MRYRLATPADLETFRSLLHPGFAPSLFVRNNLVDLWKALLANNSMRITLIEDPDLPTHEAIQMVGASVFLREDFAENYLKQPYPGLSAKLYEDALAEDSPVLSYKEIREANSHGGLHLLMLHFALRDPDLSHPRTQEVMFAVNTAFFFFYGGYHLKTAMQEVYGLQAAEYMKAGGFHIVDYFGAASDESSNVASLELKPYFLLLRKDDVQPSAVNPLSFLFYPMQPRIHFSSGEQRVLELALLNESDAEIAQALGVSPDAVKKTWRRVYERASRVAPHLAPPESEGAANGVRGAEKRRHLLDFLRIHLEELRPHEPPARLSVLAR